MSINKTGRPILILGAGAGMAKPFIKQLFQQWEQCSFYLLARNTNALQELVIEGKAKGHIVTLHQYDLEAPALLHFSGVELCITYVGWMPESNDETQKAMLLNCIGVEQFVDQLILDNQASLKHIIITGSIAGVRVRPSNRAYGLAKQALHTYALQLQQKLAGKTAVTLVIPGYVRTQMLEGMKTPNILTIEPEKLAVKYKHWLETQPKLVYSQLVWRIIGMVLKMVPQFVIDRMKK